MPRMMATVPIVAMSRAVPGCMPIEIRMSCLRQTIHTAGNMKMIFDRTVHGAQKWYTENRTV